MTDLNYSFNKKLADNRQPRRYSNPSLFVYTLLASRDHPLSKVQLNVNLFVASAIFTLHKAW